MHRTTILAVLALAACRSEAHHDAAPEGADATMTDSIDGATSRALLPDAAGRYAGPNLLWFRDPDAPLESAGELRVEPDRVRYSWSYEGEPQTGDMAVTSTPEGVAVEWTDTWHSPEPMRLTGEHAANAIVVRGTYGAGSGPDWGWRIELRAPSSGEFLMEMYNLPPEGTEQIAVRLRGERR